MWKVQLLNGIAPTQFNGNPADFPVFREQTRTHLESELLTDAQRIEYLPKFLKGEALEVIERNRGCSYKDLMKTLEDRFGKPSKFHKPALTVWYLVRSLPQGTM